MQACIRAFLPRGNDEAPATPDFAGGPGRTRTCNQTVMSGRITTAVVDFTALLQEIGCVHFASSGLFLVRN